MAADDPKKKYLVGVDLGGTKILAGVFDTDLHLIGKTRISTKPGRGPSAVIKRIARCVTDAVDECDLQLDEILSVGIGAPGPVDPQNGVVLTAPNMDGWQDVPLKKELAKLLGTEVEVENDCNASTLGVYYGELGGKPSSMIGIFLGTGIGGGLILNGALYTGFNRTAGEVGHIVIDVNGPKCGCGNRGCYEALAGRAALYRRIQSEVKAGKKTILTDMLGPDLKDLRSGSLRKALRRGDGLVTKLIQDTARYTGITVASLINLLNPEVVVLGGGVMQQMADEMMPIITKTANDFAMRGTAKGIKILASDLGDDAGITGAAVLHRVRHPMPPEPIRAAS